MADPRLQVATDDRPLLRPGKPPARWGFPLLLGALIAAGAVVYYFWQLRVEPQTPVPRAAPEIASRADSQPRIEHPIEPSATGPLPALSESDPAVAEMLA